MLANISCTHNKDRGAFERRDVPLFAPHMRPLVILIPIELLHEREQKRKGVLGHSRAVAAHRVRDSHILPQRAWLHVGIGTGTPELDPLETCCAQKTRCRHIADDDVRSGDLLIRELEFGRRCNALRIFDQRLEHEGGLRCCLFELLCFLFAYWQHDQDTHIGHRWPFLSMNPL